MENSPWKRGTGMRGENACLVSPHGMMGLLVGWLAPSLAQDCRSVGGQLVKVFNQVRQLAGLHALVRTGGADDSEECASGVSARHGDGEESFLKFVVQPRVGLLAHCMQLPDQFVPVGDRFLGEGREFGGENLGDTVVGQFGQDDLSEGAGMKGEALMNR
jgi:hypothetical protein